MFVIDQGRWELPEGQTGGQEGRAGRAAEGVHQRMEEAALQGRGGAEAPQGEAGKEEGDQSRAGTCLTHDKIINVFKIILLLF